MPQAKTLTDKELRRVLDYIGSRKHDARNRAMLLTTHYSGMRCKEVAALRIGDVMGADGSMLDEVRLSVEQTKGRHARSVFIPEKLRKELKTYIATLKHKDPTLPLFYTQKRQSFDSNTLCQFFHYLSHLSG